MTFFTRMILASLVLALISVVSVERAHAGPLDDAKAAGLIGEKADGYVGAVTGDASVRGLIDKVNKGRKTKYEDIASKRGAPVDAVAAIAGKKLIERAPSGQFVMGSNGQWRKK